MTERKWTPGPWTKGDPPYAGNAIHGVDPVDGMPQLVTHVFGYSVEQVKANRNLIATAPDLYEMGVLLLDWAEKALAPGDAGCDFMNGDGDLNQDGMDGWDELGVVINAARAALAKARGEED